MKRILIAFLFAAPTFAGTPEHFFDSLALHPQAVVSVPTVPAPPVLTPIDPTSTIAMVAVAQANSDSQWAWTKDSLVKVGAKVDAIAADEALEVGETLNLKNQLGSLQTQIAAIPQGPPGPPGGQGIPGTPGASPTIQIGTVVSVPCSTPASVTNTGTSTAAIFNFSIPSCGTTPPPPPPTSGGYALSLSVNSARTGAVNLNGATVKGVVFIFTSQATALNNANPAGVASVCYWLDSVSMSGTATWCEGGAAWDFMGGAALANGWASTSVPNGAHTLTQRVVPIVGTPEIDTASFTVAN